ncbi:MAG: type IV secretion system DNA-binding domain-containing protein [Anaerolineales bacterium]|nr:type IV secretion system DNA-binding domain-containing protein [Anaerolineales bacterium]
MRQYWLGAPAYQFRVAPDYPFDSQQILYLTNALLTLGQVAFQIVAQPTGVEWQAIDLSGRGLALESLQVHGVAVRSRPYVRPQNRTFPFYRAKVVYVTRMRADHPILSIHDVHAQSDPLLSLIQTLSVLRHDERVCYTVLVNRVHKPTFYQGVRLLDDLTRDSWRGLDRFQQALEHKLRQIWYECAVLLDVESHNFQRVVDLRQALHLHLRGSFERLIINHPVNGLHAQPFPKIVKISSLADDDATSSLGWYARGFSQEEIAKWWQQQWIYLEPSEIAALWHLPHQGFEGVNIQWRKVHPPVSREVAHNVLGVELGEAVYQNRRVAVQLRREDRATHANVVGKTGVGKSTLVHQLVRQDIAAGYGVLVLDPHGALVRDILRHSIPPAREQDVVVLDLNVPEFPLPLNVFMGTQSYAGIGRVVDIIETLYDQTGVRMDKFLRAGIKALQYVPQATMKDFYRLLTDATFRSGVLSLIEDEETHHTLHTEYHTLGEAAQRQVRAPILNRISPFYGNPYLYPSLCHPQRLDLERWIAEQKIILVALGVNSEMVPQRERNMVGSLLVSLLQMVGMNPSRVTVPFYVYIDEVQHFVTSSLATVFSEARKYGLSMTVAHQYFHQLDAPTRQAILSNVGTTIAFGVDVEDANHLAGRVQPQFTPQQLMGLSRFEAVVKMQHQGVTQDAFWLKTQPLPPLPPDAQERELRIRALSVQHYTPLRRAEVEQWLMERYGDTRFISPTDDLNYADFGE